MSNNCYFCQKNIEEIDHKDVDLLNKFTSGQQKILPPKRTGTCARHQRKLAKAVKRARALDILPFTNQ